MIDACKLRVHKAYLANMRSDTAPYNACDGRFCQPRFVVS